MLDKIKFYWEEKPLQLIMLSAFFFRMLSVIFSKGYGMHDDHFLVIEAAQSWVDGHDYNNWLPQADGKINPSGHSFFYVGLHFFLFKFFKLIGFVDAQSKMYVVRFLHAMLSLITVYFGYKITEKISTKNNAKMVGILLALLWFIPILSVRNLVEMVCIPPLIYATWLVIKNDKENKAVYLCAGLLLGLAFNVRFQTVLFVGGFGLALLFQKKIIQAVLVGTGFLICAVSIQGIADYAIWKVPFVEFQEYVHYNMVNSETYGTSSWYKYFIEMAGLLIPPVSLFLLFGYFKSWRKHLILFLPSFVFLAFHSYFPNKQERFILPIMPFIIILGYTGWQEFYSTSNFWKGKEKVYKGCWKFFWTLNTIALLVVSVASTKLSRVNAMTYLSEKKDVHALLVEESNESAYTLPPQFYLESWCTVYNTTLTFPIDSLYGRIKDVPVEKLPNYIVVFRGENKEQRIDKIKKYYPNIKLDAAIEPSFIDALLHRLNPNNKNETVYIYKIEY